MNRSRLVKQLLFFFLKFIIVYFILMLPPFKKAYADFYKSQMELWFGKFGEKGAILLKAPDDKSNKDAIFDVLLYNDNALDAARKAGLSKAEINYYGTVTCNWYSYMLAVYLLALIAAVPIGWKRRLFALLVGMMLAYAYWVLMQWVFLLHWFDDYSTLEVLQLKGLSKRIIDIAYPVMVINPGTLVFVALLIGAVVTLRKGDWKNIKEISSGLDKRVEQAKM